MPINNISQLAIPAVAILISFLAYGSQIFFYLTEPSSLSLQLGFTFNACIICLWICYIRACFTDPGHVPSKWRPANILIVDGGKMVEYGQGRCRKCPGKALKPPRSHHCKMCQRCIPKMDHHCPWTSNCVSHRTFPHFFRFLIYAVISMIYLEYFLYIRVAAIWHGRNLPRYLGPSPAHMVLLFIFSAVNSITLFALAILLVRNIWTLGANVTTIEGWEIERHETLLRRARVSGGYLDGPDGMKVKITRQEFPYDIGILRNIRQGMGGSAFLWFWPFAATPSNQSGLDFETNEFEDSSVSWPPPDPDRIPRQTRKPDQTHGFTFQNSTLSDQDYMKAFRQRQKEDLKRFTRETPTITRRAPFHEQHGIHDDENKTFLQHSASTCKPVEEAWRNLEGDRLDDFGVDESAELFDEDQIPLTWLLKRQEKSLPDNHPKEIAS